jgi:hypothetical protein
MTKRLEALKALMAESSGLNSYYDLVSEIVVDEMSTIIKETLDPTWDINETKENKKKTFRSAVRILKYYSAVGEWNAFKVKHPSKWYRE